MKEFLLPLDDDEDGYEKAIDELDVPASILSKIEEALDGWRLTLFEYGSEGDEVEFLLNVSANDLIAQECVLGDVTEEDFTQVMECSRAYDGNSDKGLERAACEVGLDIVCLLTRFLPLCHLRIRVWHEGVCLDEWYDWEPGYEANRRGVRYDTEMGLEGWLASLPE